MSCCAKREGKTLKVTLTFKREELLYDIKNCSWVEGHVMDPDAEHVRHMVTDVGEEGNVDRITRMLDLCVAGCREMLYPFTKRDVLKKAYDDIFSERESYTIEMTVPDTFSQTTLTFLERLIHEYLVCRAVAEWMSITNPGKAEEWVNKAADVESEIRTTLNSRQRRRRIVPHWFS